MAQTTIVSGGVGWIPDSFDPRDKPYRNLTGARVQQSVNLRADHPAWFEQVYDQHLSGSCCANATAAAYRYLAHKQNAVSPGSFETDPSRLFIHWNGRTLAGVEKERRFPPSIAPGEHGYDPPGGCLTRQAMKGLNKFGVCSEALWPFELEDEAGHVKNANVCPSDAAYGDASRNKVIEYSRLDPDHPEEIEERLTIEERIAVGVVTLSNLKQCLSEGYPVVFGFRYYWPRPEWITTEKIWQLPDLDINQWHKVAGPQFAGHAVLAIGYDDLRERVLCQNSWGVHNEKSRWDSEDGLFWMSYKWIKSWEATEDFWMIRELEQPSTSLSPPLSGCLDEDASQVADGASISIMGGDGAVSQVFWVTPRGAISHAVIALDGSWQRIQFAPIGTAVAGAIATVANPRKLISWVTLSGDVKCAVLQVRSSSWKTVDIPDAKVLPGSNVVALSCGSQAVKFFWIGKWATVEGATINPRKDFAITRFQIARCRSAPVPGTLKAVRCAIGEIRLFWINEDGSVQASHSTLNSDGTLTWSVYAVSVVGNARADGGLFVTDNLRTKAAPLFWTTPRGEIITACWKDTSAPDYEAVEILSLGATQPRSLVGVPPEHVKADEELIHLFWVSSFGIICYRCGSPSEGGLGRIDEMSHLPTADVGTQVVVRRVEGEAELWYRDVEGKVVNVRTALGT